MALVKIPLKGSLVRELRVAFARRDRVASKNSPLVATWSVGLFCGLKMEIRSDEHPPPHFHVLYGNEDASFSIIDCQRLPGVYGLERYERDIRYWWLRNKWKLAIVWNKSRPTGCPVGPIAVPDTPTNPKRSKKRKK